METLKFDLTKKGGAFKPMNATNGGPWMKRHATDQKRSNFETYKAARIPYARNHDSAILTVYGGPFSYDVSRIFPNFDADENDPLSYDFACTDEAIACTMEAGTQCFFRLGETIEHQIKKHNTLPPKDFKKWAVICEHIIRHYNEGWADGYHLNMEYWEIWNEPDLDDDDSTNKRTWGGTQAQFFDLYEIAAKHLKQCFPHLKIGGPALAYKDEWAEEFLREMRKRNVEIDFFSWHIYATSPEAVIRKGETMKRLLLENGYDKTESILNEWNYVADWGDGYVDSLKIIHGMKGAAFIMSCIIEAQKSDAFDMLMYYDTRQSCLNGVFDFYTYEPLKGYYPLMWYGKFYDMEHEVRCEREVQDIHTLCGVDKNGKVLCIVMQYNNDDTVAGKTVQLDFGKTGRYEVYCLDNDHDGELLEVTDTLTLNLSNQSCYLIKEI